MIAVCDGLAMNHEGMKYSLASREIICDSVEVMMTAHALDGMVLVPNCDKTVPAALMAAARLNVPSLILSGGPMLAGRNATGKSDLITVFEGVGAVKQDVCLKKTSVKLNLTLAQDVGLVRVCSRQTP